LRVLAGLRLLKTEWPLSETITPAEPSVFICDHPCLLDTVTMAARYDDVVCLMKQSYYDNPLFFGLAKLCGYIPAGYAGSVRAHQRMVEQAVDCLRRGCSVLAFPESRRTPLEGRVPFGRGPFEIAARAGVPVVPVKITCTPRTLAREIPLHTMPTECVRYSARQHAPRTVAPGRASTKAATQAIQNLLQPVRSKEPHASLERPVHEKMTVAGPAPRDAPGPVGP
jgi:1-acyl-sn-glycerol-3-phosphate acyltransferase